MAVDLSATALALPEIFDTYSSAQLGALGFRHVLEQLSTALELPFDDLKKSKDELFQQFNQYASSRLEKAQSASSMSATAPVSSPAAVTSAPNSSPKTSDLEETSENRSNGAKRFSAAEDKALLDLVEAHRDKPDAWDLIVDAVKTNRRNIQALKRRLAVIRPTEEPSNVPGGSAKPAGGKRGAAKAQKATTTSSADGDDVHASEDAPTVRKSGRATGRKAGSANAKAQASPRDQDESDAEDDQLRVPQLYGIDSDEEGSSTGAGASASKGRASVPSHGRSSGAALDDAVASGVAGWGGEDVPTAKRSALTGSSASATSTCKAAKPAVAARKRVAIVDDEDGDDDVSGRGQASGARSAQNTAQAAAQTYVAGTYADNDAISDSDAGAGASAGANNVMLSIDDGGFGIAADVDVDIDTAAGASVKASSKAGAVITHASIDAFDAMASVRADNEEAHARAMAAADKALGLGLGKPKANKPASDGGAGEAVDNSDALSSDSDDGFVRSKKLGKAKKSTGAAGGGVKTGGGAGQRGKASVPKARDPRVGKKPSAGKAKTQAARGKAKRAVEDSDNDGDDDDDSEDEDEAAAQPKRRKSSGGAGASGSTKKSRRQSSPLYLPTQMAPSYTDEQKVWVTREFPKASSVHIMRYDEADDDDVLAEATRGKAGTGSGAGAGAGSSCSAPFSLYWARLVRDYKEEHGKSMTIQLVQADGTRLNWWVLMVYRKPGSGNPGRMDYRFESREEAVRRFCEVFEERSGNAWGTSPSAFVRRKDWVLDPHGHGDDILAAPEGTYYPPRDSLEEDAFELALKGGKKLSPPVLAPQLSFVPTQSQDDGRGLGLGLGQADPLDGPADSGMILPGYRAASSDALIASSQAGGYGSQAFGGSQSIPASQMIAYDSDDDEATKRRRELAGRKKTAPPKANAGRGKGQTKKKARLAKHHSSSGSDSGSDSEDSSASERDRARDQKRQAMAAAKMAKQAAKEAKAQAKAEAKAARKEEKRKAKESCKAVVDSDSDVPGQEEATAAAVNVQAQDSGSDVEMINGPAAAPKIINGGARRAAVIDDSDDDAAVVVSPSGLAPATAGRANATAARVATSTAKAKAKVSTSGSKAVRKPVSKTPVLQPLAVLLSLPPVGPDGLPGVCSPTTLDSGTQELLRTLADPGALLATVKAMGLRTSSGGVSGLNIGKLPEAMFAQAAEVIAMAGQAHADRVRSFLGLAPLADNDADPAQTMAITDDVVMAQGAAGADVAAGKASDPVELGARLRKLLHAEASSTPALPSPRSPASNVENQAEALTTAVDEDGAAVQVEQQASPQILGTASESPLAGLWRSSWPVLPSKLETADELEAACGVLQTLYLVNATALATRTVKATIRQAMAKGKAAGAAGAGSPGVSGAADVTTTGISSEDGATLLPHPLDMLLRLLACGKMASILPSGPARPADGSAAVSADRGMDVDGEAGAADTATGTVSGAVLSSLQQLVSDTALPAVVSGGPAETAATPVVQAAWTVCGDVSSETCFAFTAQQLRKMALLWAPVPRSALLATMKHGAGLPQELTDKLPACAFPFGRGTYMTPVAGDALQAAVGMDGAVAKAGGVGAAGLPPAATGAAQDTPREGVHYLALFETAVGKSFTVTHRTTLEATPGGEPSISVKGLVGPEAKAGKGNSSSHGPAPWPCALGPVAMGLTVEQDDLDSLSDKPVPVAYSGALRQLPQELQSASGQPAELPSYSGQALCDQVIVADPAATTRLRYILQVKV